MSVPVGVVDLGTGNLFSVLRGLERAGGSPVLVTTPSDIRSSPRLILPGVGAFAYAARRAKELGLRALLLESLDAGAPVLGICLGMQLLFDEGDEDGRSEGLALLPGRVIRLSGGPDLPVPHVGWQRLRVRRKCELLGAKEAPWFYFSHSYRAAPATDAFDKTDGSDEIDPTDATDATDDVVTATVEHGETIPALVSRGRLFGLQPHPEKSGDAGRTLLSRFLSLEGRS